jgi:acetolactate synthase regulatory subunit
MNAILQVRARDAEGVLVRILGLVRRRGYQLLQLSANRSKDEQFFDVVIVIEGERSPELLVRQMAKLWEVEKAHLFDSGAAHPPAAPPEPASEKPRERDGKTQSSHPG